MTPRATAAAAAVSLILLAGIVGTGWDVWACLANRTTITEFLRGQGVPLALGIGAFAGLLAGVALGHLYGGERACLHVAMAAAWLSMSVGMLLASVWLQ